MRKSAIALAVIAVLAMSAGSAMAEHGSRHGGRGRHGSSFSVHVGPPAHHNYRSHHGRYHHGGATVYRSYGYPTVYPSYGYPTVYRSYHHYSPRSGFSYRGPGFGISIGF